VFANISFLNHQSQNTVLQTASEQWEDEPYWIETDARQALEATFIDVSYIQVSECAEIYVFPQKT
jgi:hypothetical protein